MRSLTINEIAMVSGGEGPAFNISIDWSRVATGAEFVGFGLGVVVFGGLAAVPVGALTGVAAAVAVVGVAAAAVGSVMPAQGYLLPPHLSHTLNVAQARELTGNRRVMAIFKVLSHPPHRINDARLVQTTTVAMTGGLFFAERSNVNSCVARHAVRQFNRRSKILSIFCRCSQSRCVRWRPTSILTPFRSS